MASSRRGAVAGVIAGIGLSILVSAFVRPVYAETEERTASAASFSGGELPLDRIEAHLTRAKSQLFRPVGTSSVVFHMVLEGEISAAFRPRTRKHPGGHKAEVAAYRLARALGLDNVPPAIRRRISRDELRARLHPEYRDAFAALEAEIAWNKSGSVQGAAIYWIPQMRSHGLDRRPAIDEWSRWLRLGATVPEEKERLAADLSTMLAFDYLIGNWDRFSGGNVQGLPSGERLFVRDHNLAFAAPLPGHLHDRIRSHLRRSERFSRELVRRLVALDASALRSVFKDAFARDDEELLTEAQLRGVLDRRATLLSYIGALIDESSVDRVLAFP